VKEKTKDTTPSLISLALSYNVSVEKIIIDELFEFTN